MSDDFNENFKGFSHQEDLLFIREMLLQSACEMQDAYNYIYDAHRQFQTDELTRVIEYVRLARVGLEHAFQDLDEQMLDQSEAVSYTWIPNNKERK